MMDGKRDKTSYYQLVDDENSDQTSSRRNFPLLEETSVHLSTHSSWSGQLRGDLFTEPPESHEIPIRDISETSFAGQDRKSPENEQTRWTHIQNLDEFFTRVYEYHQKGGFWCILTLELASLLQFIFLVSFATFLLQCIDYAVLFGDKLPKGTNRRKSKLTDSIVSDCCSKLHPIIVVSLLFACLFWLIRAVRMFLQLAQSWEIRSFYLEALGIPGWQMDNLTWHQVLQRLKQVQPKLHLVIDRTDITELDVYQRILRHKNYLVAMVNKNILSPKLNLPFLGEIRFLSNGFKLNLKWLLFWGPWSPWQGPYALRNEFKSRDYLDSEAIHLSRVILWTGVGNLLLSPVISLYQILYSFCSYAEMIKREPGILGMRRYSHYGRYYLRHFNELDHELKMRLNRGYAPAQKYMEMFVSRFGEIFAKNLAFVAGTFFAVLFILSAWDEDVLEIEHVLTVMTVFGLLIMFCRVFIADENLVWCPELLMNLVVAQVHYIPDSWTDQAHTDRVRQEFSQLFQLKAYSLLEELASPLITPLVLLFWMRPRARQLVDFFHQFTVRVDGLGDVCSFAQMDPIKHGDSRWNFDRRSRTAFERGRDTLDFLPNCSPFTVDPVDRGENRANNGKIEMSLIHFTLTNPIWKPPSEAMRFLRKLKETAIADAVEMDENRQNAILNNNPLLHSLHSLVPLQSQMHYSNLGLLNQNQQSHYYQQQQQQPHKLIGRGVGVFEGPLQYSRVGPLSSSSFLSTSSLIDSIHQSKSTMAENRPILDGAAAEMSLNALYLHQLHAKRTRSRLYGSTLTGGIDQSAWPLVEMSTTEQRSKFPPTLFEFS